VDATTISQKGKKEGENRRGHMAARSRKGQEPRKKSREGEGGRQEQEWGALGFPRAGISEVGDFAKMGRFNLGEKKRMSDSSIIWGSKDPPHKKEKGRP